MDPKGIIPASLFKFYFKMGWILILFKVGFSPGSLIIYIILWLVIPEAVSTAEKLEMKGEKVDMNSIKNSVMEEMKGVQQRAEKFGKEATLLPGKRKSNWCRSWICCKKRRSLIG